MLLNIAFCYAVVAGLFFLYNFVQFLKTKLCGKIYIRNFNHGTYEKNAVMIKQLKKLFAESGVELKVPRGVNAVLTSWYSKEFAICFKLTEIHYVLQMLRSLVWFTFVLDFREVRNLNKTQQILISVIAFLLQFAATYLLELFLETTGIRNNAAASLLDFLKSAF